MRISQDIRDYAAANGLTEGVAVEVGMKEKAAEFAANGNQLYAER